MLYSLAFFKVEKSKLMNIMRALGLCTYYLKSICISCFSVRS